MYVTPSDDKLHNITWAAQTKQHQSKQHSPCNTIQPIPFWQYHFNSTSQPLPSQPHWSVTTILPADMWHGHLINMMVSSQLCRTKKHQSEQQQLTQHFSTNTVQDTDMRHTHLINMVVSSQLGQTKKHQSKQQQLMHHYSTNIIQEIDMWQAQKHLHDVETHLYCPHSFLGLHFSYRSDTCEFK